MAGHGPRRSVGPGAWYAWALETSMCCETGSKDCRLDRSENAVTAVVKRQRRRKLYISRVRRCSQTIIWEGAVQQDKAYLCTKRKVFDSASSWPLLRLRRRPSMTTIFPSLRRVHTLKSCTKRPAANRRRLPRCFFCNLDRVTINYLYRGLWPSACERLTQEAWRIASGSRRLLAKKVVS